MKNNVLLRDICIVLIMDYWIGFIILWVKMNGYFYVGIWFIYDLWVELRE